MKIYVRLFLRAGLPFAIIMALVLALSYGFFWGLIYGLLAGIVFGLFMSLILGSIHIEAVKRVSGGRDVDITTVYHEGKTVVARPFDKAFDLCELAVSEIKGGEITSRSKTEGILEARSGRTWKSFGEVITFTLKDMGGDRTEVEFSSRPAAGTTVVDYGKNLQNVRRITVFLEKQSP